MSTTAPRFFAFVLMPFDESFDDVYQIGIKEACESAGAYCERVDEQIFSERILDRIYNQIAKADLVIADMTGRNPNVFYEVGYAHALGKPTVLITKETHDIPFDLKHFPHIIYQESLKRLREDLSRTVSWYLENPSHSVEDTKEVVVPYFDGRPWSSEALGLGVEVEGPQDIWVTLKNISNSTIDQGGVLVGVVTTAVWLGEPSIYNTARLPEGLFLHSFEIQERLFPQQDFGIHISLGYYVGHEPGEYNPVDFRIYTSFGLRNYPLILRRMRNEQNDDL